MRLRHHFVPLNGALRSGTLAVLMGCLFGRTLLVRSQLEIKRTAEPDNLADHAEGLVGFAKVEDVGFERGIGGVGQQFHAVVQQAHTLEGGVGAVHAQGEDAPIALGVKLFDGVDKCQAAFRYAVIHRFAADFQEECVGVEARYQGGDVGALLHGHHLD